MSKEKDADKVSHDSEIWVTDFTFEAALKFRNAVQLQHYKDPSKPIAIYINSYGGYADALASMIETIEESSNPIITICHGTAMSCGAILLSCGDLRFCGKHSRVMVHEVSGGAYGDVHDVHNDAEETKRLNEYFLGLMAKNCGFKSYAEFRKWLKEQDGRDRYMNAEQALKFGIIDAIGIPRVATAIIHEIRLEESKSYKASKPLPTMSKKSDSKKRQRGGL